MCSCIENLAKYFLLLTNVLAFLASLAVLGVSIWILADQPSFLNVLNIADEVVGGIQELQIYQSATIILLVVSILVIIITFLGCCGAWRESRCMLATYFGFVILLLIGTGVGAYFAFSGNLDTLKTPFLEALKKYDDTSNSGAEKTLVDAWDSFQQDFQCCGVDSFTDWSQFNQNFQVQDAYKSTSRPGFNTIKHRRVPESCCDPSMNQQTCAKDALSSEGLYAKGCFELVVEQIEDHEGIIGWVAIGILVAMVINAVISIYMATCGYNSEREKRMYGRPAYQ